jgi:hypothetical protein
VASARGSRSWVPAGTTGSRSSMATRWGHKACLARHYEHTTRGPHRGPHECAANRSASMVVCCGWKGSQPTDASRQAQCELSYVLHAGAGAAVLIATDVARRGQSKNLPSHHTRLKVKIFRHYQSVNRYLHLHRKCCVVNVRFFSSGEGFRFGASGQRQELMNVRARPSIRSIVTYRVWIIQACPPVAEVACPSSWPAADVCTAFRCIDTTTTASCLPDAASGGHLQWEPRAGGQTATPPPTRCGYAPTSPYAPPDLL